MSDYIYKSIRIPNVAQILSKASQGKLIYNVLIKQRKNDVQKSTKNREVEMLFTYEGLSFFYNKDENFALKMGWTLNNFSLITTIILF